MAPEHRLQENGRTLVPLSPDFLVHKGGSLTKESGSAG